MQQAKNFIFPNLVAEMARAGITVKTISEQLEKSKGAIYFKLNGKNEFTLQEMEKIKAMFNTGSGEQFTFDYLFFRG